MYERFKQRVTAGEPAGKVLDELGMKSYCCRALFMTHVDTLEKIAKFRI